MEKKQNKKTFFSTLVGIVGVFAFLIAVGVILILIILAGIIFAGKSTISYTICDEIKPVSIDFDQKHVEGIYTKEIEDYATSLKLKKANHYHGCVDNTEDSIGISCYGFHNSIQMTGKWKLLNDSYYVLPYGIHINGGGIMDFVALEQSGKVVFIPLFELDFIYPEYEKALKNNYRLKLEMLRKLVCVE